jgi:hypothetical protein
LLFIIYINILLPALNTTSELIIFADYTNVIIYSKNFDDVCRMSNTFLSHMNKWFTAKKMALNVDESNVIKLITNTWPQYA